MIELKDRKFLVTGGTGFIGSAVVRALVREGARVRCLDNNSRGSVAKLGAAASRVELVVADIRDPDAVRSAVRGMDTVCHLAYINGTEHFYSKPDLVLEVAVKGMLNVLDACTAERVGDLLVASSSEVYQNPPVIPTPEDVPLVVPDVRNPRYSYGGGKIISELLALHCGRTRFERVVIFRPHNVYGPNMGFEHVIPQFAVRMKKLPPADGEPAAFDIQGTGDETRAFMFIDDFADALLRVIRQARHLDIYHLGATEEVTISTIARLVAGCFGREIRIVPGRIQPGSAPRRCPDTARLRALGFEPRTPLKTGIASTVDWYKNTP